MTNNQTPKPGGASGADQGWAVIGYLLAGMILWGGVGWLLDEWLGIPKHLGTFFLGVIGAAGGMYMVVKRFGQIDDSSDNQSEGRKR